MKYNRIIVIAFAFILSFFVILFIAAYPFITIQYQPFKFPEVNITQDVDEYLKVQESKHFDIAQNAHKKILWHNIKNKEKTNYSFVFIHGGFATGYQHESTVIKIAKSLNANLFITRLSGHGVPYEGSKFIKFDNLLKDAVEAVEVGSKIGKKVIVMGYSLGGALVSIVASDPVASENIDNLILLAPAHSNMTLNFLVISLISFLFGGIDVDYPKLFNVDENKWDNYWSKKVDREQLLEMWKVLSMSDQIGFDNKKVPLLLIYNKFDRVITQQGIKKNFAKWKGPKMLFDLDTQDGGPMNHDLIGLLNPNQDDVFVDVITKWVNSN